MPRGKQVYIHARQSLIEHGYLLLTSCSLHSVHWNTSQPVFDHAVIMFRLPRTAAGLGYAGACRPLYLTGLLRRCRVDLKKMCDPAILSEWRRLLNVSLSQPGDESVEPPDPFMALKHAETVADNIAFSLAPRRGPAVRRPVEVQKCFGFGGH